jgi:protein-S-isoprenylcysteine O-methyltransferase Ste14
VKPGNSAAGAADRSPAFWLSWEPVLARARKIVTGLFPVALIFIVWRAGVPSPPLGLLMAGLALVATGVGVRIWAAGYLVKRDSLTVSGPYAHLRHPLYLGSVMAGAGFCLASGLWWSWAALGLLAVPVYASQIGAEERYLATQFGTAFARYRQSVPRLIPRWRPLRLEGQSARFSLSRVLVNREHHWSGAVLLLAVALWLVRAF